MPKPQKKGKGPRGQKDRQSFDENALEQLTSKIGQNLNSNTNKRKHPPTNAGGKEQQKRRRNFEDSRPSKNQIPDDQAALLAEIRALGGDEKDLELINGVDSDDETYGKESGGAVDKDLKDELLALSKELGFADIDPEVMIAADEQPYEVNDDEDEEEGEDSDHEGEDDDVDNMETEAIKRIRKPGDMIFEPRADWHAYKLAKLPKPTVDQLGPFAGTVEALKTHAKTLLESDCNKYKTSVFASSSHKFLSTIMSSGTLTDKVSALTLAVQESPVHNIRAFDALMNLASKKSRGQAIGAIGALVDLLGPGTLLPADRRLRPFHGQPGLLGTLQKDSIKSWTPSQPLPGKITEEHLISWLYEDWLKETYFKIIQLLETWCSDEIEYSRMKAVDFVYGLLKEKPEQESNLLTLLVNKLGDRDRKISSRASHLLLQLQVSHPGMKPIIIRTIEQDILLHPSQDHRSKYCAINTLNQTILSNKEPAVAETLLRIYFDLFVTMLRSGSLGMPLQNGTEGGKRYGKETGKHNNKPNDKPEGNPPQKSKTANPLAPETEAADKLVSALLTGVNRAAPFIGTNDDIMEKHLDTLFRIAHSANFNTGIQALLLIQHLSAARNLATDRFYRTLYESLLDPRLVTSSKQALYLNLLLRALKSDVDVRRVKAFAKRMLQISSLHQPPFVCGLLYVIAHLRQTFPDLSTLVEEPEASIFDDEASAQLPGYDGHKRDPKHSNAQRSCLWEMIPFQTHFHPSVSVFAAALLDKTKKVQKPDMESHTLIRFLDKFVYRNPKSTDSARGVSIMQPLRATKDLGDFWLGSRGPGTASAPVNSAAFWKKKVEDIAADDVFFHEYFQHVAREPKPTTKKANEEEEEETNEDEIWKALVSTQPDIEDDADEEGFDDMDGLDMDSEDGSSPALSLESDLDDDEDDEMRETFDGENEIDSDGLVAVEDEQDADEGDESQEKNKKKSRRKALKDLPMFASVDDYAELLAAEEDGL
ncbi:Ribosome biogenesis protein NOC1 [Metarhizium brunneum]|uniref:Ribosome biogenesis protein NOC1 n=1 Tax=Metarhizium brunneum TaxID=500148 RepID=A0A7D5V6Z9_9HYPO